MTLDFAFSPLISLSESFLEKKVQTIIDACTCAFESRSSAELGFFVLLIKILVAIAINVLDLILHISNVVKMATLSVAMSLWRGLSIPFRSILPINPSILPTFVIKMKLTTSAGEYYYG